MSLRWRAISVAVLVGLFGWLTAANFVSKETREASAFLPNELLRMGLDLRGGIHWVIGVDMQPALERECGVLASSLETRFGDDGVVGATATCVGTTVHVAIASHDARAKVDAAIDDYSVLDVESSADDSIDLVLAARRVEEMKDLTMAQVLEVLRRRIDDPQTGIPESVVTRQGEDRVLVQIPGGLVDRDSAYRLLESTAFLEFKIVEDAAETDELLLAKYPDGLPDDKMIVHEEDPETKKPIVSYLVAKQAPITGQYLADARVGFDNRQRPEVEFSFDNEGGKLFGDLTEKNIERQLAIILDDRVYSAPTVQSRISTRGRITGRFSAKEAADLAVILRAGSLAVPVEILEERTVGPALGQDSIDSGVRASIVGLLLVVAFAIGYYRLSGGYASIALAANLVMLLGLMSLTKATLTLPGIAGLVLTIGMAIDANVIIFERIREEIREGRATRAAIATGFNKALWTVLDANITTLITGIILFQYGTGPIKGFAVTLCVGIVTSVFTALVVTRILFQLHPGDRPQPLSI